MIPVNTPLLDGNELKYLTECIDTGWISSEGPFINKFEDKFSSYIGMDFGIAVSNGSAALDVAIRALEIKEGDEVIMPTFTIISPAQSIVNEGGVPVLVDCDPHTFNMDTSQIESKINKNTKAILVVHIYGLPVDMDPIIKLCKKYNLILIEDAAEMHGQTYNGKMCGSFGDISIFSFYPNKHITTGEGGMILCKNSFLAERCRKLRNLAFEPNKRRFIHYELGWNYRMTNLQAALGLAQLENIEKRIIRKREIGSLYQDGLKNLKNFQLPIEKTDYASNIYWVFTLVGKNEEDTTNLVQKLSENKIATRPFFWCMHEQPVFLNKGLFNNEAYPVSERIARNGFYLPSGLGISDNEIKTIIDIING
ncbi:DegT/DnrJ/EryC1/StrS family aminotransferase [Sphingobacterium siyangense]|uniref:DegT/DnrJ/EryC1/StrS family aminotransferase n=1 Tax=Sphingobacterium siyangense TaxID=459529 RepID=UPI00301723B8